MRRGLLLLIPLSCLIGCKDGAGERVRVSGTIKRNGAPIANAVVTFIPDVGNKGNGGFGRTDANGRYEVGYPTPDKGMSPGRYKVTVGMAAAQGSDPALIDGPFRSDGRFPEEFSSSQETPLRAEVVAGGPPIDFQLDDELLKPKSK